MMRSLTIVLILSVMFIATALPVSAQGQPPSLRDLKYVEPTVKATKGEETGLPFDIRHESMKEAALSYGARGGLAWRTWHIRQELETRASYMERVFDFRQLLIPAPSGLMIEPPIISESLNAMIIDNGGMEAAVSDRVLNISQNAKIVSAPRTWRAYLERSWGEVIQPPDILLPQDNEEREKWIRWIEQGWAEGVDQANEIFQTDLNQLTADFRGMVRYKQLLKQGMVSPPYALQVDRGVTGGGDEMRVGDRAVSITNLPALKPGFERWKPVNR
ncbi:MAG: type IV secretion system DotC family protein [Pseudomonadota bacterium]